MKEGWKYAKVGQIFDTYSGGTPLKSYKEYYENGNIPWLCSGEVCRKYITSTEKYITQLGLDNSSAKYYPENTVVVAMYGATAAQVGILKCRATSNQAVCGILPNDKFLPEFVYNWFLFRQTYLASQAQGGAQPNISQIKIKNIEIPVLSLSEQQQIVDFLDAEFAKIDELKNQAEQSLQNAKELFQSALKEMLTPKEGWVQKKLADLCSIQSGYAFKSQGFKQEGKYQVIRMGNVRPGIIRYDESAVFVDCDDDQVVRKALLEIGDIIITQTGTRHKRDYGFTAIIDAPNLMLNQRLARIRVGEKLSNKYLLYHTWTDFFRDQFFANEGGAVGQGNVGMDAIKENVISLPPLEHQIFVVETLDSLHKKVLQLQSNYSRTIQLCADLKQALLRQVFE